MAMAAHTYNPVPGGLPVMCHHAWLMHTAWTGSLMHTKENLEEQDYNPAPVLIFWTYSMRSGTLPSSSVCHPIERRNAAMHHDAIISYIPRALTGRVNLACSHWRCKTAVLMCAPPACLTCLQENKVTLALLALHVTDSQHLQPELMHSCNFKLCTPSWPWPRS